MSTQSPSDADLAKLYEAIRADIAGLTDDVREAALPFYNGYRAHRVARTKGGMDEIATYADVITTYPAARAAMDAFKSAAVPTPKSAPEPSSTTAAAAPKTEASVAPTPIVSTPTTEPDTSAVITGAAQLATLPDGREVTVRLDVLVAHARNAVLLPASTTEEDDRLAADIEAHGLVVSLIVAGSGCASPPGTLLDGHRRSAAMRSRGITEAKAVVRSGLTAHDEEMWIVRSAIASQLHRKLTEADKYKLEERARELLKAKGLKSGFRSDLHATAATSVASNGGSVPVGEASAIVAKAAGESENAVRERQKIFGSPVTTEPLKKALADGKVSRKKAAAIVREVEGAADVQLDTEAGVEAARSTIDQRVKEAIETLRGGPRPRKPKVEPKPDVVVPLVAPETTPLESASTTQEKKADTGVYFDAPTETHDVEWSALGGAEVELLGHLVHFSRTDKGFRIEVVGRE
ncbi:MAG: hypothetical protein ACHREM_33575 [Polyangiales bacterium]